MLLTSQFTRLVPLASIIALPLTHLVSEPILDNFTNRIELDVVSYASGVAVVLLLTWIVVGYHVIRATRTAPVESLRYE